MTCFETGYACENDGDENITTLPVWFRGSCCVFSCSRVFGGADESRVAGRGVARCRACACMRLCRGCGWCDCVPLWSIIQRRPFGCHAGCSLWFCDGALRGGRGAPSVGCTAHTAPMIWTHLQSLPSVNYLKICCDPHGIVSAVWNRRLALKELWARIKYLHFLQQLLPSSYLIPPNICVFPQTLYMNTLLK